MPTGIVLFPNPQAINRVDDVVAQATRAYDLGVRQVWLSQQNDHDAIALAAVVGAAVPGLGVGTRRAALGNVSARITRTVRPGFTSWLTAWASRARPDPFSPSSITQSRSRPHCRTCWQQRSQALLRPARPGM
jgi:hypothetical protein